MTSAVTSPGFPRGRWSALSADEGGAVIEEAAADPVTGACPRASLEPQVQREISRAARTDGAVSLFLFDVDFFKTVNDVYGHLRGDQVLRQLADRIKAVVREYDVLYRYGGDEFVLLLPDTPPAEALRLALRLVDEVKTAEFPGEPPLTMSVSLGVASFPQDGRDTEALLAAADRRNYIAKRRGRGCAVADDADTGEDGESRLMERDTELAVTHDYLTQLRAEGCGVLQVKGPAGAGHTRFLAEVHRLAAMRGMAVVPVPPEPEPLPDLPAAWPSGGVLLLADVDAAARGAAAVARWAEAGPLPDVVGLVYATTGRSIPADAALPVLRSVELAPWSPATLKIWLRKALRGEPSRTLVTWFSRQSAGLPAAAERELSRLRSRDGLVQTDDGGWTVSPALLGRPRRQVRLPAPVTRFIGREVDARRVANMLENGRVVTLAGPGGIGKTRLSLAVARTIADRYDDGVGFVALAEATTSEQVLTALAQAVGVDEVAGQSLLDTIIDHLADSTMLLVLDNFEQVVEAGADLADILGAAPSVSVLVTSREPLGIYGEMVYRVPPLPLPDPTALVAGEAGVAQAIAEYPAVALFDQRARGANYDFVLTAADLPAVVELCRQLDGLPLAIELAAARIERLTPHELLTQLTEHLDSLGDGPRDRTARQQTLRGAIDWSYELLDPAERHLFEAMSVFTGGSTVEAAAAVLDPDILTATPDELAPQLDSLVNKSLLTTDTDGDGGHRYRMLKTIHAYATVKLSISGADQVRDRHLAYYGGFAQRSAAGMAGPEQAEWAERLQLEYPNLRGAITWALEYNNVDGGARICLGLWRYWRNGNHIREGREWLDQILSTPDTMPDELRAQLLYPAAVLAATQDDTEAAARLGREALILSEILGDRPATAQARNILGVAAMASGRYDEAADHYRYGLAVWRELDQPGGMAIALGNLATVALRQGDVAAASDHINECLELERAAGNSRGVLLGLECLGQIRLIQDDLDSAEAVSQEALTLSRQVGDVFGEAMALHQLGQVAQARGDRPEALRLFVAALERRHEVGELQDLSVSLDHVAELSVDEDPELAVRLLGAVQSLRHKQGLPPPPDSEARREETLAVARTALGERAFASAWNAGRAAPLDLVVDHVLDHASVR